MFALNVNVSEPFNETFTTCSSEKFFKKWFIVNTLFERSVLRSDKIVQRKGICCFCFENARTHSINGIFKTVSEFMFIQRIEV